MNMMNESISRRTLFIDFDLYADNDPDFKLELIQLMIENLEELQQAFILSVRQNDLQIFIKACHKVKTTLCMLADGELDAIVEDLKVPGINPEKVSLFNKLNVEIINSLSAEKSH